MATYKRILVPVDGSETSSRALNAAIDLARENAGLLQLVHTVDELAYVSGFEYSGDVVGIAREGGRRILDEAKAVAQAAGVECGVKLVEFPGQRLGQTVAEAAREFQADLIVVGTHGRRGFSRALLGSGAEQIIRMAPVHVLVVRGSGEG